MPHGNARAELVRCSRQVRRARAPKMTGVIARFGWGVGACSFGLPLGPRPSTRTGSLPLSRDGRSCRHEASVLGAATGPLGEHFQYPFGCTRPPRSCTEECGRLSFESGALAAFNAMSFNSSLLCPRTLGSDAPSRTADIRLCTSVTVLCRPVPMLYPGRFDGRATGAHKGLD